VAIQNQAKKRLMTSIITYVTCGHKKSKSGHPNRPRKLMLEFVAKQGHPTR
jgi:hypothetical protein